LAGVYAYRIEETAANELKPRDEGLGRLDVVLDEGDPIDRLFELRRGKMLRQRCPAEEQAHAKTLATAVVLEDQRIAEPLSGRDDTLPPNDSQSTGSWNVESSKSFVLSDLADFEPKRPAVIHHRASVPLKPGQDRTRVFGRIAMITRVRRGAHPVVEYALRRRRAEVQHALVQEPLLKWGS
jgi:hypothetical protein